MSKSKIMLTEDNTARPNLTIAFGPMMTISISQSVIYLLSLSIYPFPLCLFDINKDRINEACRKKSKFQHKK